MTANTNIATHIEDHRLAKNNSSGVRSAGLLAKWPLIGLLMFLFGGLAFGGLTYNLVTQGPLLAWDKTLATTLPAIGLKSAATLKPIMDAGYYLGSWGLTALGFLFGLYFVIKRYWQELAMLAIGMAGESLLFLFISNWIGRVRPPTQIWIILHIPGFPSGHALASVVLFGFLAYLLAPRMRSVFGKGFVVAAALVIILFIGFTRVFTAAHYLTDVLAGYALGLAWSGVVYTLIEIYFQKRELQNVKKE
ncbi:MAG TPA: phosphatase PAP2 family protein [Anaerolineales bacterium]|nr:phosphatase PAP2 family protein [Anaerolineales bacterium]HLO32209.1 phosphatase PAP2 family protein [Anaerolineales bacterium]